MPTISRASFNLSFCCSRSNVTILDFCSLEISLRLLEAANDDDDDDDGVFVSDSSSEASSTVTATAFLEVGLETPEAEPEAAFKGVTDAPLCWFGGCGS